MFDDVLLDPEHEGLLVKLVEAQKGVPSEKRHPFILIRTNQGDFAIGGGRRTNINCPVSLYRTLLNEGLLQVVDVGAGGSDNFDVTVLGYRYYEYLKNRSGQPVHQVESEIRSFLDGPTFQARHPLAYQKWVEAERLLWGSDSERQFTTIGHLCREAIQEFADGLVKRYQPPAAPEQKELTFARVRAVLQHQKDGLGEKKQGLLDALLVFWDKAIDLVQRQEHGGQKQGDPLAWEDGRRAVFQTAIVMFEIDRALS